MQRSRVRTAANLLTGRRASAVSDLAAGRSTASFGEKRDQLKSSAEKEPGRSHSLFISVFCVAAC